MKNTTIRKALIIGAFSAAALGLTACGDDPAPASQTSTSESSQPSDAMSKDAMTKEDAMTKDAMTKDAMDRMDRMEHTEPSDAMKH
ncbi:hypothetical protein [Corynebacterium pseudotuberculosis]|uniref:hypothetical protein n=1 Tax=Corynebacterium pseudotuberculosis TaxID=1719 RepID=UPI001BDC2BE1|nr:hypothetical protein [Corynebacterium pseudotuberculosis]MBT1068680.1 hypothetical protein [Corynebacterium pseudotuberculosis]